MDRESNFLLIVGPTLKLDLIVKLDRVAQGINQTSFWYIQGWSFLLCQCLTKLIVKNIFLIDKQNFPVVLKLETLQFISLKSLSTTPREYKSLFLVICKIEITFLTDAYFCPFPLYRTKIFGNRESII